MKRIKSINGSNCMISLNHLETLLVNGEYNAIKDSSNNLLIIEEILTAHTANIFNGTVYGPDMKKHCSIQMTISDLHTWGGFETF